MATMTEKEVLARGDLAGKDLSGLQFDTADLEAYDFTNANLTSVQFRDCDLTNIETEGAIMTGATITGSLIQGVIFTKEQLEAIDLSEIQQDFFATCDRFPVEVPAVYQAIMTGRLDGNDYDFCFIGVVARERGVSYTTIPHDATSITEMFLSNIEQCEHPGNNPVSAKVAQWLREWIDTHQVTYIA